MNIAEAKEYIKDTVSLYLQKDEFGDYRIPVVRQRPIFLLGAPGIGKTAVMSQVASELNIALVSYSMTHHTRQSALGLPFIEQKEFDGNSYRVSEYTMSEIISSVYDTMEESGVKEGILFLDEINCVSETLYPSMLQFLQVKVFGKHQVPEGWVIVTAGNPPEFNKSVREFDVVTLDRLKVMEVEADYPAWKKYANDRNLHGAILNFLDTNKDYFYMVETTAYGKNYVTARGWEDLSEIITLYEENHKKVTQSLIGQYIKHDTVVKEFAAYYDLYNKYKRQYDVEMIFEGKLDENTKEAAGKAPMDERLALTGMLADRMKSELKDVMHQADLLQEVRPGMQKLMEAKDTLQKQELVRTFIQARKQLMNQKAKAGSLTALEKTHNKRMLAFYQEMNQALEAGTQEKEFFNQKVKQLQEKVLEKQTRMEHLFAAMSEIFGEESNEMLVLVTELTMHTDAARFLATFRSAAYETYNSLLMVGDRNENLRKEIMDLL